MTTAPAGSDNTGPEDAGRPPATSVLAEAGADLESVTSLVQSLVRTPSRGGIDHYGEVVEVVTGWFSDHGLPCRRLYDNAGGDVVGIVCDVTGIQPGPRYVLDACLDTAPFGDPVAWRHPPTSGTVEDGWLYGRGAADSKAAIAIFAHIAARIRHEAGHLHGSLTLLFDADEHTGRFGGAKRYFRGPDAPEDVAGVMIGYPGSEHLIVGGRGFLRAELTVRGRPGHTGSKRSAQNAVEKAAQLVLSLREHETPAAVDDELALAPCLTVTRIAGGESYSIVPDHCVIGIDIRLTTTFDESAAKAVVQHVVRLVDEQWPATEKTTIAYDETWPAFVLGATSAVRAALTLSASRYLPGFVGPKVAGPSNIGNFLAQLGIDATAGLGVRYEGLHGTDERIELSTMPAVQATYHDALLRLLRDNADAVPQPQR